jgi:predicted ATPase
MARNGTKTLRFTRLKLVNWRNFRHAEVRLDRRAFFVGPNASGKSNLLEAIKFLRDLAKPVGGGLGAAVAERGGVLSVRCLHARGPTSAYVEIEVDVGDDDNPALWNYRLQFTQRSREKFVSVRQEEVKHRGKTIQKVSRGEASDGLAFSQTLIEQVKANEQFRELAAFFASVRYLHVVPQIVRDARRALDKGEDPFGGDLLRRINETKPERVRTSRLKRIAKALSVAVPNFVDLRLKHDNEGRPHLEAGFRHWRPNLSYQTEEAFSDGTLRLIGFLWSIAEGGGPLLLEEPELSLHDDVVRRLPIMIARMQRQSGRQVLMTTFSDAMTAEKGVNIFEVHRLVPSENGTIIETASENPRVQELVKAGFTVGEAVMPLTRPSSVDQLSFFDAIDN